MFAELDIKPEEMPEIYENISTKKRFMDIIREYNLSTELDLFLQNSQIIHGDLNSGNIILDGETCKITLLDFEHAWIGPAVLNWYDFLLRNLVLNARRYPMECSVVIKRLEKLSHNADYFDCTKAILEKYGVHHDLHGQFMALYMGWLLRDKIVNEPGKVMEAVKHMEFSLS
jgi:serine/threonine protein kinase